MVDKYLTNDCRGDLVERTEVYFVGIIEDINEKDSIGYIVELLSNFGYVHIYKNNRENIIYLSRNNIILVVIDINPRQADIFREIGIEFDILIHNFMGKDDYRKDILMEGFLDCRYYILNSDDENWTMLPLGDFHGIVITYGFNSKATLTISSYNINPSISANLCLQREIISIWNKKIEPFEFTVEADSHNRNNIYPILAASILGFILLDDEFSWDSYKEIRLQGEA